LCSSCVPEKVGVNKKLYSLNTEGLQLMEINQTDSIKLKMRGHKLSSGVNW
jgi:hypothetical protein